MSDTLKRLDIFFKARRADISDLHKWIRKSWDDLIDGGGYAAEYVTPDGMIYRIRTSDDFRVNINLMDDAGDMLQDTLQAGKKADNAGGLAVKGGTVVRGTLTGKLDGLTAAEKTMVNDLLNAGNNVEIIPRSNILGQKTPDFLVNGVKTELKTLTGTSLNTPVTRIQDGFKQGAEVVIIDGRNTGLTVDNANTVIERVLGKYGGELPGTVEIWTVEGIIRR